MGTRISQSDLARDALYTKVNQIGDEKVDLESNQTIDGRKTFTSNPYVSNSEPRVFLNSTDVTRGTAPSSKEVTSINFQDANGDWYGYVQGVYDTNKSTKVIIGAKKSINSSDSSSVMISVGYDGSGNPYTYAPTPSDTTTTSGTQMATTGWVNSTNNNVVHRTGDETIAGTKTFTNVPIVSRSNPYVVFSNMGITKGTNPSESRNYVITCSYNNSSSVYDAIGRFEVALRTNGTTSVQIAAYKNKANSTENAAIAVSYPQTGSPYTSAPTPTDTTSTSGTQIATTGWVNSVGNNVVHRTDNETIAGTKTFSSTISGSITGNAGTVTNGVYTTGNQTIAGTKTFSSTISGNITGNAGTVTNGVYTTGNQTIGGTKTFSGGLVVSKSSAGTVLKNTAQTKGTAPSGDELGAVEWQDSAGKTVVRIRQRYTSSKNNYVDIMCYKANSSSDTTSTSLQVVYPASGNPYATAPNSDVNGSIVTTVNKSKATNGYFKLGNGLIIQWGSVTAQNAVLTITLPTSFASTNYTVAGTTHGYGKALFISDDTKTTTNFKLDLGGGIGTAKIDWIAIGY